MNVLVCGDCGCHRLTEREDNQGSEYRCDDCGSRGRLRINDNDDVVVTGSLEIDKRPNEFEEEYDLQQGDGR